MSTATLPLTRDVQELIARCESVMVLYRNSGRTPKEFAAMAREIREAGKEAAAMGLVGDRLDTELIRSVRSGMLVRYGSRTGAVIFSAFHDAIAGRRRD